MPRHALVGLSLALLLASAAEAEVRLGTLAAAMPQPATEALNPGLRVRYAQAYFNHVDEMVAWSPTVAGAPVPRLAAKADSGPVLTSTASQGVGATLTGFLHLAQAGTYRFKVNSNDGVRLRLGDKLLYEDPFRHSARMSEDLVVEVMQPGWYPLKVLYYQAKGDWTLELFWQPPGAAALAHVPAEAFAHLDETASADPVAAAKAEAAKIIGDARAEAAAIIAAARKQAAEIVAGAKPQD
jgi:hypothetical protein